MGEKAVAAYVVAGGNLPVGGAHGVLLPGVRADYYVPAADIIAPAVVEAARAGDVPGFAEALRFRRLHGAVGEVHVGLGRLVLAPVRDIGEPSAVELKGLPALRGLEEAVQGERAGLPAPELLKIEREHQRAAVRRYAEAAVSGIGDDVREYLARVPAAVEGGEAVAVVVGGGAVVDIRVIRRRGLARHGGAQHERGAGAAAALERVVPAVERDIGVYGVGDDKALAGGKPEQPARLAVNVRGLPAYVRHEEAVAVGRYELGRGVVIPALRPVLRLLGEHLPAHGGAGPFAGPAAAGEREGEGEGRGYGPGLHSAASETGT